MFQIMDSIEEQWRLYEGAARCPEHDMYFSCPIRGRATANLVLEAGSRPELRRFMPNSWLGVLAFDEVAINIRADGEGGFTYTLVDYGHEPRRAIAVETHATAIIDRAVSVVRFRPRG
jgi:hypothetical protein